MKSLIFSGLIIGALVSLAYATDSVSQAAPQPQQTPVAAAQQTPLTTELQGPEARDDHAHHYHYSSGQELFSGDEWLLCIPLLLIPLIAFACWYLWGGSKDDGYGWDRMGYSDTAYTPGAYESRMFRGADSLDKRTHQRIFNAIQQ